MITIKDYENVLDYFKTHEIPDNLKNFVAKLEIMYQEILYRNESNNKIKEFHEKLDALYKK